MENHIRNEFLKHFPVFKEAPGGLADDILLRSQYYTFSRDQVLYSEGDACRSLGFLLSGEVRVYKIGETGREITLYKVCAGETCILGASSILSSRPYPANAVGLEDGSFLSMPAAEFAQLMATSHEMQTFLFRLISDRLAIIMELVEDVAFGRMDERILEYLQMKAEGGKLHTTHQKIANDLGTSREVVSRLLKDFERQGKVALSRNMIEVIRL